MVFIRLQDVVPYPLPKEIECSRRSLSIAPKDLTLQASFGSLVRFHFLLLIPLSFPLPLLGIDSAHVCSANFAICGIKGRNVRRVEASDPW
jgi:hypothetical protein